MKSQDDHHKKLEAQLHRWHDKIDEWKVVAGTAKAELKVDFHRQIKILQLKLAAANLMLQSLKESENDMWVHAKAIAERAWEDLKKSFEETSSRFK